MPSISRSNRHQCLNFATMTTAIALAFCIRIWVVGVHGLIDTSSVENRFIMVDAVVVDLLDRRISDGGFCPQVKFPSRHGQNITVIIREACVMDSQTIVMGSIISIRYNPQNPNEFIEEGEVKAELTSLKIMLAVGMSLSFILSGIFFSLLKWRHRRQSQRFLHNIEQFGNTDASDLPVESLEERKEQIISNLCFQTVRGNVGVTTTASIRSGKSLCSDASNSETSNSETMDIEIGDARKKEKDCNGDCEDGETARERRANCDSELEAKPDSGTTLLLLPWWTPAHDTECSICLERYKEGEVICASKSKECDHVFHKDCLVDWMMKNNGKCPLCRFDFLKEA